MSLTEISIVGFRGFSTEQILRLAEPNGAPGSGLTVITGPNNGGKSSILECLKARSASTPPSFTIGARNAATDHVCITFKAFGATESIVSLSRGSSETAYKNRINELKVFHLPSRRAFVPYFQKNKMPRENYMENEARRGGHRPTELSNFPYRLFKILENPAEFNELLYYLLPDRPEWTIDLNDQGSYFLKFYNGDNSHTSDGLGEGIVSLFAIVDAFYDSAAGDVIVVDEPELSLHPALQKRLALFLNRFAADRQVVISTHSPYFVSLASMKNGGTLARVVSDVREGSKIYQLSEEGARNVTTLGEGNKFNPHVFGLDARELFFQEDGIILVEGQEDVVFFPDILQQLAVELDGHFFGWGVGGAENMPRVCKILTDLGYQRVAAVLDADKEDSLAKLRDEFPLYHFTCIPAADVRTKPEIKAKEGKIGLLDEKHQIRSEFKERTAQILNELNRYLANDNDQSGEPISVEALPHHPPLP
ncbi:ATP-dependent nuclease [Sinorhizobium meliloti]|uniref:ATP-dependent nuclease n=1 Tax=Rhizobium meliloti TaxID=382 RepID=UPI000FD78D4A|nr:AAA family ATPase [Sinorhizobium meliloti]RVI86449.1 hypothetical protein CN190_14470 [Sinorhizobium meliloti]